MPLETKSFEFADFRLEAEQKVLLRNEQRVSITPKAFQLLLFLVENQGRSVLKSELMQEVWADSFVEEGNLTFTVNLLRKTLGDDRRHPRFIETLPKRGYRFIAEVNEISTAVEAVNLSNRLSPGKNFNGRKKKSFYLYFAFAAIVLISAIALGAWLVRNKNSTAPILSAPFAAEKISTSGKVFQVALSPDGKTVVYNTQIGDKQSLWLRQLETDNNTEIIPPSDDIYIGLDFSPDGNFVYFVRRQDDEKAQAALYRVSLFGGIPQKIVSVTEGWFSLSPDGKQISFVRCPHRDEDFCSLWTADAADGNNEKKILSRPRPIRIGDNRFSPDGKSIAFAAGQSVNQSNEFGLLETDLETGAESEISKEKFFDIKRLVWLPDQSGLLITAIKTTERNFSIRHVSLKTGEVVRLTNDSENYSILSLNRDATGLISTQIKNDFNLVLLNPDNSASHKVLAKANDSQFAPNGKIYFSSKMSGDDEIWSINADGGNLHQLTNNPTNDVSMVVSPDNNFIFFCSNRTGAAQIWRMEQDGANQVQITNQDGGFPIFVSPDNQWVYYLHGITRTLWRVSLKDGSEQMVFDKPKNYFAVSPDGLQLAFAEKQGEQTLLTVASLKDGKTLKTFALADKTSRLLNIVWMPDGKSLAYISTSGNHQNYSLSLQKTDESKPRVISPLVEQVAENFAALSVAPDGKTFAIVQGNWLHDAVLLKGLR